jgi:hypothetical protein
LCLIAPSNQDAVLAWGSKFPGAKIKQGIIDGSCEDDPPGCHPHTPSHENYLEIEVQKHAWAGNQLIAKICVEGILFSFAIVVFWCMELLTCPESQSLGELLLVANWAGGQIHNPEESEKATTNAEADHSDQSKPVLVVADSICSDRIKSLALGTRVSTIIVELGTMLNHGPPAGKFAFDDIWDWSLGVELSTH